MPFPLREWSFVLHRLAGLVAGAASLLWLVRFRFPQRLLPSDQKRSLAIRIYQFAMTVCALTTALSAWIARSRDGRLAELVSPWPVYNLVSQPDDPLSYRLLQLHNNLAGILVGMVALHVMAGLLAMANRDRTQRAAEPAVKRSSADNANPN